LPLLKFQPSYESGVRVTDLANMYSMSKSTISTFLQRKDLCKVLLKISGRLSLRVLERIIGISIISYGKNSLDLRPTWVTTSPLEQIEFVSQGPTVYGCKIWGSHRGLLRNHVLQDTVLYSVDCASRYKFLVITNLMHFFMYLFISRLYMFRASQRLSSGDRIVLIHHLVW